MAKRNRGKTLRKLSTKSRGECPLCRRKGVKLLYELKMETNNPVHVCKNCRHKGS